MNKKIILLLVLLSLTSTTASAEVSKTLLKDSMSWASQSEYAISGVNKKLYITMCNNGFFESRSGISKLKVKQNLLMLSLVTPLNTPSTTITEMIFLPKQPPYFIVSNNGNEEKQILKVDFIANESLFFVVDNIILQPLSKAERVFIVLTLKNGTIEKIEIPDEVLKEWKEIIDCDLLKEYKKEFN